MESQPKCRGSPGAVARSGWGRAGAGTGSRAVEAAHARQAKAGEYFPRTLQKADIQAASWPGRSCVAEGGPGSATAQAPSTVVLAGDRARAPCFGDVHGDRSRCRRDPHRLLRGGRTVGHHCAAAAIPGDHRPREGAGLRPDHRRLAAAICGAVPGGAVAPWQGPLNVGACNHRCSCSQTERILARIK